MTGANQALSYIVFFRERVKFEQSCPGLEIVFSTPLNNYLRYLLSGGLNFRAITPAFAAPAIRLFETILIPLNQMLALHHVIVIRKRTGPRQIVVDYPKSHK
jgi:hypothetical protein